MEDNNELKTEWTLMRERRDDAIVSMYEELMKQPGAMIMPVMKKVAKHFGFYSTTAIWAARKRVAARRQKERQRK